MQYSISSLLFVIVKNAGPTEDNAKNWQCPSSYNFLIFCAILFILGNTNEQLSILPILNL